MRIIDALQWGEKELKKFGVENPRWDADSLLGHILNVRREQLYLERESSLNSEQQEEFRMGIVRRTKREPLQYILKRQEFMGLEFYVDSRVLIPRADSEILIERLLEGKRVWRPRGNGNGAKPQIADICTGSGALAISIAHYWPEARVVGTDLSTDALEVARYNARKLKVQVEWRQGDFLAPIYGERWDIIVSNPPYISNQEYNELSPEIFQEPKMAFIAGEDGLDFYRTLAQEAKSLLKPDGQVLVEIGWQQGEEVKELFMQQGFSAQVFKDYGGRDRVVFAR